MYTGVGGENIDYFGGFKILNVTRNKAFSAEQAFFSFRFLNVPQTRKLFAVTIHRYPWGFERKHGFNVSPQLS